MKSCSRLKLQFGRLPISASVHFRMHGKSWLSFCSFSGVHFLDISSVALLARLETGSLTSRGLDDFSPVDDPSWGRKSLKRKMLRSRRKRIRRKVAKVFSWFFRGFFLRVSKILRISTVFPKGLCCFFWCFLALRAGFVFFFYGSSYPKPAWCSTSYFTCFFLIGGVGAA